MIEKKLVVVSVIMTVYNHEEYIEQALESIALQEFDGNIEVLIGEDKSSDKSKQKIQDYIKNNINKNIIFKPIFREKNLNRFNIIDLLQKSNGKYIFHLEGDDFWIDRNKIQKQVDFMECNPNIFACGHPHYIYDTNLDEFSLSHKFKTNTLVNFKEAINKQSSLLHPSSFCYRNKLMREDYSFIVYSNRFGAHSTMINIFANKSDIYIFKEPMSVWRKVVDKTKSNYTSFASQKRYFVSENNFFKTLNFYNKFGRLKIYKKIIRNRLRLHSYYLLTSKEPDKLFRIKLYIKYIGFFETVKTIIEVPFILVLKSIKKLRFV